MLFATSILLSLASSLIVRTKGNRLLSSTLSSVAAGKLAEGATLIPAGPQTVSYWEKYDGEHSFLEDVGGDAALSWVKTRNVHAIDTLGHPETCPMYTHDSPSFLPNASTSNTVSQTGVDNLYESKDVLLRRPLWFDSSCQKL